MRADLSPLSLLEYESKIALARARVQIVCRYRFEGLWREWRDVRRRHEEAIKVEASEAEKNFYRAELKQRTEHPPEIREAVGFIREAIEKSPKEAKYHYTLGRALRRLKEYEKANDAFKDAIAVNQNYGWAYANWARSIAESIDETMSEQDKEARRQQSAEKLRAALAKSPENASIQVWAGMTYAMLKMSDRAVEAYQAAMEADPKRRDEMLKRIAKLRERITLQ